MQSLIQEKGRQSLVWDTWAIPMQTARLKILGVVCDRLLWSAIEFKRNNSREAKVFVLVGSNPFMLAKNYNKFLRHFSCAQGHIKPIKFSVKNIVCLN